MIVGLTGGTGTGKTMISEYFKASGFEVIDYDKVTREIYKKGSECLCELVCAFGEGILTNDGELERRKLGSIVFANKEKLDILNKIVYKYILEHTKKQIEESKDKKLLLDAPTLFEAELHRECDYVVGVIAKRDLRLNRICKRDGLDRESALNRILSQKDDDFYRKNCHFIIENNSTREEAIKKAEKIIRSICK